MTRILKFPNDNAPARLLREYRRAIPEYGFEAEPYRGHMRAIRATLPDGRTTLVRRGHISDFRDYAERHALPPPDEPRK